MKQNRWRQRWGGFHSRIVQGSRRHRYSQIVTRFPGQERLLHIGHAKSIALNSASRRNLPGL